jgi:hypothetical protein
MNLSSIRNLDLVDPLPDIREAMLYAEMERWCREDRPTTAVPYDYDLKNRMSKFERGNWSYPDGSYDPVMSTAIEEWEKRCKPEDGAYTSRAVAATIAASEVYTLPSAKEWVRKFLGIENILG